MMKVKKLVSFNFISTEITSFDSFLLICCNNNLLIKTEKYNIIVDENLLYL